jgi:pimeloyl-ACP methyl ester carboxylesterase
MTTEFFDSSDGFRLAFDVQGSGLPLVLLHGGMLNRTVWQPHRDRLVRDYCTIAMDLRGHGESAKPTEPSAYRIDRLCDDVLRVASHCGVDRFDLWGYSYGANIGRYVAARSDRIRKLVMTGVPFGPGASGTFRDFLVHLQDRWTLMIAAKRRGTVGEHRLTLAEEDQLESGQMEVMLAWMSALLGWPAMEPEQLRCPTLWLTGSNDLPVMADIAARGASLSQLPIRVHILDGLTHEQEIEAVDLTVPLVREFLGS